MRTATEFLAKHRIGAVIVSRDGAMVDGILSERDIVRALGTRGVCDPRPAGAGPDDCEGHRLPARGYRFSVMERMTDGRFRHMPVIDDNRMIGVISIGDVVKARISEMQTENAALTDMISNSW